MLASMPPARTNKKSVRSTDLDVAIYQGSRLRPVLGATAPGAAGQSGAVAATVGTEGVP
jgi:hypothetical protein